MNKNKAKATSTPTPADSDAPPVEDVVEPVVIEGEAVEVEPTGEAEQGEVTAIVPAKGNKPAKLTPEEKAAQKRLGSIAVAVRKEFGKGIDTQFAIGHLLVEARGLIPSDRLYGQWLDEQDFGFQRRTAARLMQAALREPEVREFIATRSSMTGKDVGPVTAIALLEEGENAEGRVSKQTQQAVQELVNDEPIIEDDGFRAFVAAAEALDMSKLELGDLVEVAGIISGLAAAYKAEKARR